MSFILLSLVVGGCSPTIGQWTDRGREGLNYTRETIDDLYKQQIANEQANFKKILAAATADLQAVRDGKISIKNADGQLVKLELTDKWLADHQAGLELAFKLFNSRTNQLLELRKKALENIDLTAESFDKIDTLNRAFITTNQTLMAELQKLANKVENLKQKGAE